MKILLSQTSNKDTTSLLASYTGPCYIEKANLQTFDKAVKADVFT